MRAPNILRGFDDEMRNGMRDALMHAGIAFRFGCLPTRIQKSADGSLRVTLSDGAVIEVDEALIATGRLPNTKGLGLEASGVELSPAHGAVKVDENLTSSVPSIHAVGDVTSRIEGRVTALQIAVASAASFF